MSFFVLPGHPVSRIVAAALIATTIAIAPPLRGGEWHTQDNGSCSDCHTQHNSEGGVPARTDGDPSPAAVLLKRASAEELCLSCHDGSSTNAPDVLGPVSYVTDPAGGFFSNHGMQVMTGHDVGTNTLVVPPGGTQVMILTCTTCHDPHGNTSYRNLRPDPSGSGISTNIVMANQITLPNGSNPAAVYVQANLVDKGGMSSWCNNCHNPSGAPPSDHSIDKTIWGSLMASYTTWAAPIANRVRAVSPADDVIPSQDDQVFCLSCHKAHGNDNYKAEIYPDGVSIDSACLQCHDQ